VTQF